MSSLNFSFLPFKQGLWIIYPFPSSVNTFCHPLLYEYPQGVHRAIRPPSVTFLLGLEIMYYPNITSYITHSFNSLQHTHFLPFSALPKAFKSHLQTIVMRLAHKTAHRNQTRFWRCCRDNFSLTHNNVFHGLLAAQSFEKRRLKNKPFLKEGCSLLLSLVHFSCFQGLTEHPGSYDFILLKCVNSISALFWWCCTQHTNSAGNAFQNRNAGSYREYSQFLKHCHNARALNTYQKQ